ncbi:MAG: hypothetical protein JWM35_1071 [Verrucomicrobia bacterium]|nr:hypothetical protein [Verrucomicrobiota bacterium]
MSNKNKTWAPSTFTAVKNIFLPRPGPRKADLPRPLKCLGR